MPFIMWLLSGQLLHLLRRLLTVLGIQALPSRQVVRTCSSKPAGLARLHRTRFVSVFFAGKG
jgi:hypothetical protein